jgi:hypothetical protein
MRAATSRTARFSAAAAALSMACAVIGAPIAVAQTCPNGEMALDGTCIPISSPLNTASDALGLPSGTVDDVVPSLNQSSLFDNNYFDEESVLAQPGFNGGFRGGGGGHGR